MSDFVVRWLAAVWEILALSGPWLLVGFALAGVIKVLLPDRLVHRHLGRDDARSVLKAAITGVPLPLCSCSVLPTAVSLRKSGASKGATTSFLVSTPETGVDSIGITWALMDPVMTVVRPVAALLTALVSGLLVNVLVRLGLTPETGEVELADAHDHDHDHCDDADHAHGDATDSEHAPPPKPSAARALRYAFGPLLDDLTPWFLVGLALSGLIAVLLPDDALGAELGSSWLTMLAMLVVGVPMYVCATASTPIAAVLVAKGLDPGAALVFLLAGPATNLATMAVVRGFLGGRVLGVYLLGIATTALACGALLGPLYDALGVAPFVASVASTGEHLGALEIGGGVVIGVLLLRSAVRVALARRRRVAGARG